MAVAIACLCFLVSGACGLMYETVWVKEVSYVFGSTVTASTVVLGTFMGGLALGSWAPGRRIDRLRRPLRAYGVLEIAIALSSMAFPPALEGVRQIDRTVLVPAGIGGAALFAFQLVSVSLLLLVPCALMGATLPVLCRFAHPHLRDSGRTLGVLYAANSAGAVAGGLAAGFYLIEHAGLPGTTLIAQSLNVLAGLAALVVDRLIGARGAQRPVVPGEERAVDEAGVRGAAPAHRIIHLHVFLCGFTAMLFEIALMKLLPLIVGSSIQSFSLMVCAFITGIALGSALAGAFVAPGARLATMGRLLLAVGLLFLVSVPLYNHLPRLYVALRTTLTVPYLAFQLITFSLCFLVMLAPTLFLGAVLPVATHLTARGSTIGADVGRIYAANTIGNILGTAATGLALVPGLGFKRTMELGVAVNVLSGLLLLWRDPSPSGGRRLATTAGVAALALAYALAYPAMDVDALTAGVFRTKPARAGGAANDPLQTARNVIWSREDGVCFVTVTETAGVLTLRVNGKADASTGTDMRTQKMLAHVPMLVHAAPKEVLVIGLGSGISAAAALKHAPARVECVEISPAVVEASRLFGPWNGNLLEDPRVQVFVDDGRRHVERSRRTYDVVISEPSNPWMAGIGNLYTVEFFRALKKRLAPGGVLAQWMHLYDMDAATFRLVLRTMREVFPHVFAMKVHGADAILVASLEPVPLALDLIERRVLRPGVREDLASVGVRSLMAFAGHHFIPAEHVWEVAGTGPVNRDEAPVLEYSAPRMMYEGARVHIDTPRTTVDSPFHLLGRFVRERPLDVNETVEFCEELAGNYGAAERIQLLREALGTGDSAEARALLATLLGEVHYKRTALAEARRAVALSPGSASYVGQALVAAVAVELAHVPFGGARRLPQSLDLARQLAALTPEDDTVLDRLGYLHYLQGDWAEAEMIYRRAIQLATRPGAPPRPRLRMYVVHAAIARLEMKDAKGAREYAQLLDRLPYAPEDPDLEHWLGMRLAEGAR